jgi:hypothetical protein
MPLRYLLYERKREGRGFREPPAGLDDFANLYQKAARQLAGTRDDGGTWALPILFLYRHAIEVLIKAILTQFGPLVGVCPKCVLRRSHGLKKQLDDLGTVAKLAGATLSSEFRELIEALDRADPHGMKARYPVTIDGQRQELEHGDSFHLKPLVDKCDSALDELTDLLADLDFQRYCDFLKSESVQPPGT